MTATIETTEARTFAAAGDREIERRDALVGRLFQSLIGTMDLLTVYLGDRLGLYRALAERGPATAPELATRTDTNERYIREWLEQQAMGGILDVVTPSSDGVARRYALPAGHAEVLLDANSPNYLAACGRVSVALGSAAPAVMEAFRTGGGVSWAAYGADLVEAQGALNRPVFLNLLAKQWLPTIPDVHAALQRPGARVADIACGHGWSSIAIALAYPFVQVDGFDLDGPSLEAARTHAAEFGVADRVRFHLRDAGELDTSTGNTPAAYDLVLICESLHDFSRPVEALKVMRRLTADGGAVLVIDERTAETFDVPGNGAPGDDVERLLYGFSVLCCLPCCMSSQPSAATGTVMRPSTLRQYAAQAGFRSVDILPIEHDLLRVYRLVA